ISCRHRPTKNKYQLQTTRGFVAVATPNRCLPSAHIGISHQCVFAVDRRSGLAQPPIRGLIVMKSAIIKVAAVAAFTMLAGCQDLKPLQADVDNLKQQVSRLTADLAAAKSSAYAANAAAQSASSTASGAQRAANPALPAAQASQSCCDATSEKIDRMFRRSISKYSICFGLKRRALRKKGAAFFFVR